MMTILMKMWEIEENKLSFICFRKAICIFIRVHFTAIFKACFTGTLTIILHYLVFSHAQYPVLSKENNFRQAALKTIFENANLIFIVGKKTFYVCYTII